MVIKLKKLLYSFTMKLIIFIVAVVAIGKLIDVYSEVWSDGYISDYFAESFEDTAKYEGKIREIVYTLSSVGEDGDTEYINSENFYDDIEKENYKAIWNISRKYEEFIRSYENDMSYKEVKEAFKKKYSDEITKELEEEKQKALMSLKSKLSDLRGIKGIEYHVIGKRGEVKSSGFHEKNIYEYYRYMIRDLDNSRIETNLSISRVYYRYYTVNYYLGINKEFLSKERIQWEQNKGLYKKKFNMSIGIIIVLFLAMIYLAFTCGKKAPDSEAEQCYLDSILNEIKFSIWAGATLFMMMVYSDFIREGVNNTATDVIPYAIALIFLTFIFSLIRQFKGKTLLRNTLVYLIIVIIVRFIRWILKGIKRKMDNGPLKMQMFPTNSRVEYMREIQHGLREIKRGNLDYVIPEHKSGIYGELAENINSITEGLKNAVANEVKSERMKSELISNVSHDIRTPLTSIINYVDLLSKEELNEQSREYIEILNQKSDRLKQLVENLFEAAKASSGAVPVTLETIEIYSLLNQCLGEMIDQIEDSKLDFIVSCERKDTKVKCDGKHMWRVFENLITNITKYSMENTRVYISIIQEEGDVKITFKNISKESLNIDEQELMERFVRGDESRNTEGSGLGLAIAKSLCEIQNGKLDINIDGDLFKAQVNIPKVD